MAKEILTHIGFGQVKFGMTADEIIKQLGEPSSKEEEKYFDELDITLEYEELGLSLFFASENQFKLDIITFHSAVYLYKGEEFIGLNEAELMEKAIAVGLEDLIVEEDEDLGIKSFESEAEEISFYIASSGIVDSISIMPKYVDDKPIWPN